MKSFYTLSEMNTVVGGVHRPQEVEVREIDTDALTEHTVCTVMLAEDGTTKILVAPGASIEIVTDPDAVAMPLETAEAVIDTLELLRNVLHSYALGRARLSQALADQLRRRIDRHLRG